MWISGRGVSHKNCVSLDDVTSTFKQFTLNWMRRGIATDPILCAIFSVLHQTIQIHFSTKTLSPICNFSFSSLHEKLSVLSPPYLKLSLPPATWQFSFVSPLFFFFCNTAPFYSCPPLRSSVTLSMLLAPALSHSQTWGTVCLCRVIESFRLTGPGITSSYVCVRKGERGARCSPYQDSVVLRSLAPSCSHSCLEMLASANGNLITTNTA